MLLGCILIGGFLGYRIILWKREKIDSKKFKTVKLPTMYK